MGVGQADRKGSGSSGARRRLPRVPRMARVGWMAALTVAACLIGTLPATHRPVAAALVEPARPHPPAEEGLTVEKTVDAAEVGVGEEVNYRIVVTNTGDTTITDASVTDDLSDVLDHGTLEGPIDATSGTIFFTDPTDPTDPDGTDHPGFTWTGDLAPGADAEITYTVTADTPGRMHNEVTWGCQADEAARWVCTDETTTWVESTDMLRNWGGRPGSMFTIPPLHH